MKFFFSSLDSLDKALKNIFQTKCPHCKRVGFLILHSKIYRLDSNRQIMEHGQRCFCSNRGKKRGCGQTIDFNLTTMLPRLPLETKKVSKFILHYIESKSASKSWFNSFENSIDITRPYKFFKLVKKRIYKLIPHLVNITSPPIKKGLTNCLYIFQYIKKAFPDSNNCIEALLLSLQSRVF